MTCANCGKRFRRPAWPATRSKYCNVQCNKAAYGKRHKKRLNAKAREWRAANPARSREIKRKWNNSARGTAIRADWYHRNAKAVYQRFLKRGGLALVRTRELSRRKLLATGKAKRCVRKGPHRGRIECHHKDGDPFNRRLRNLLWLCVEHHREHHREFRHRQKHSSRQKE